MIRPAPILAIAAVLCVVALLVFALRNDVFDPGPCPLGWSWGTVGGGGSRGGAAEELLQNPNFGATPDAAGDLRAGIVDERLVAALAALTEEHQICVASFKEGHYFVEGVPDGPLIPESYGEAGGLPNTHYFGRAADIWWVDREPVTGNGMNPSLLNVGQTLAAIPPQQRPDQIIGPSSWAKALGYTWQEGWVLNAEQLRLHEDHLHIGYTSEQGTLNVR